MEPISTSLSQCSIETSLSDEVEECRPAPSVSRFPGHSKMVYNVNLGRSHAVPEHDEHLILYYWFKNGQLEDVHCCIRSYANDESPNPDPFNFRENEFEFMISSLTEVLTTPRHLCRANARFDEKTLTVRSERVEDRSIVQPRGGDVYDHIPMKSIIVLEVRRNSHVTIRELEVKTAYGLLDALKNVVFITKYAATTELFVILFYGLAMLRVIEQNPSKWSKLVQELLTEESELKAQLDNIFATKQELVFKQFDRIFRAFNTTPQTFSPPTPPKNTEEALPIIRVCLRVEDVWADRFFVQLF